MTTEELLKYWEEFQKEAEVSGFEVDEYQFAMYLREKSDYT